MKPASIAPPGYGDYYIGLASKKKHSFQISFLEVEWTTMIFLRTKIKSQARANHPPRPARMPDQRMTMGKKIG